MKIFWILLIMISSVPALEVVRGANAVLNGSPHARNAALAGNWLGLEYHPSGFWGHVAPLADAQEKAFTLSHAELFQDSRQDFWNAVLPIDSQNVMQLSLLRYSVTDFYRTVEGEDYEGLDIPTFDIADWVASAAWAHRWNWLSVGAHLHVLLRDADQMGLGYRADLSGRAEVQNWYFDLWMRGASSSGVLWEDSEMEVEPAEMFAGIGFRKKLPYFYGQLNLAWQSSGMFQRYGKSTSELNSARVWDEPWDWFKASSVVAEFRFDRYVSLRGGLRGMDLEDWSAGFALQFHKNFSVDYAMRSHPTLDGVHFFTLTWTPSGWTAPSIQKAKASLKPTFLPSEVEKSDAIEPELPQNSSDEVFDGTGDVFE